MITLSGFHCITVPYLCTWELCSESVRGSSCLCSNSCHTPWTTRIAWSTGCSPLRPISRVTSRPSERPRCEEEYRGDRAPSQLGLEEVDGECPVLKTNSLKYLKSQKCLYNNLENMFSTLQQIPSSKSQKQSILQKLLLFFSESNKTRKEYALFPKTELEKNAKMPARDIFPLVFVKNQ